MRPETREEGIGEVPVAPLNDDVAGLQPGLNFGAHLVDGNHRFTTHDAGVAHEFREQFLRLEGGRFGVLLQPPPDAGEPCAHGAEPGVFQSGLAGADARVQQLGKVHARRAFDEPACPVEFEEYTVFPVQLLMMLVGHTVVHHLKLSVGEQAGLLFIELGAQRGVVAIALDVNQPGLQRHARCAVANQETSVPLRFVGDFFEPHMHARQMQQITPVTHVTDEKVADLLALFRSKLGGIPSTGACVNSPVKTAGLSPHFVHILDEFF